MLDLEIIGNLLDDYAIALGEYYSWKERLEAAKDPSSKNKLDTYLKKFHDKREEIDDYLAKVSAINNDSAYFFLSTLIFRITSLHNVLKNDLDNLNSHKENNPAVYLLDNYRHHLISIVEEYKNKINSYLEQENATPFSLKVRP